MAKHRPGPCSGLPPLLCVHREEPLTHAFCTTSLQVTLCHPLTGPWGALVTPGVHSAVLVHPCPLRAVLHLECACQDPWLPVQIEPCVEPPSPQQ